MKKKILVVTGTRAEYGLLRSTMDAILSHTSLSLKLLVTGMHTLRAYGYTIDEIRRDGYRIDCIAPVQKGSDMLEALTQEIAGIRAYCLENRPDCILVLGDRDEPFAAAIVAAHLHIPIAHIHGGDSTGPGVDESIRHAITKFAHLHFPGTKKSAARVRELAEEPGRIFSVGSVVVDMVLQEKRFTRNDVAKALKLDPKRPWLTVLQHPTPFDATVLDAQISATLKALNSFPDHEKIIVYPNSDTGTRVFIQRIQKHKGPLVHIFKSLPRLIFMSAVSESETLLGNSSAGIIEAPYLGTPTVNIGNRQRGRERGRSVIDAKYDTKHIVRAIEKARTIKKKHRGRALASPYGEAGAGKRIANILSRELARKNILDKRSNT